MQSNLTTVNIKITKVFTRNTLGLVIFDSMIEIYL